jgi:hypothetical protein
MALTEEQIKLREASALRVLRKRRSIREKAKLAENVENVKKAQVRDTKKTAKEAQFAETKRARLEGREQKRLGLIEQAKLKRVIPAAFASQNAPVFSETGQEAKDTPEEQDVKQRKELRRQLGDQAKSAQPQNFVVEKPLAPNAMDLYEAQKMSQRANIRNAKAFAPVQKL